MTKQIASFSLSEESFNLLDKTAQAIGKNRSEFLEWLIVNFCSDPDIAAKVKEVIMLQKQLGREVKKSED